MKKSKAWHYEFPSHEEARAHLDDRFGGPYPWPEVEEVEPDKEPF